MSTGRPSARIIDITRLLRPGMPVWPGDPELELTPWARIPDGDPANLAVLRCGLHSGTHLDAPYHVLQGSSTVEDLPLDPFIGKAGVIRVEGVSAIDAATALDAIARFPGIERLLFFTGAWGSAEQMPDRFASLDPGAAEEMLRAGVKLFGTDAPSIDPADSDLPAHRILLGGGVQILENLDLAGVEEGEYELVALPLRIRGGDGSPVRAVLLR